MSPRFQQMATEAGAARVELCEFDALRNGENFNIRSGPGDRRAEQSQKAPASFLGMLPGRDFGKTLRASTELAADVKAPRIMNAWAINH